MISGSVVAEKYFLLGCSFDPCSLEYCSIDLSLYVLRPNSSCAFSKNSPDCFPTSSIQVGGRPSISVIRETWLYSDEPGNSGRPRKSSTTMQPNDHMSIEAEYLPLCQPSYSSLGSILLTVSQVRPPGSGKSATVCKYKPSVARHMRNQSR